MGTAFTPAEMKEVFVMCDMMAVMVKMVTLVHILPQLKNKTKHPSCSLRGLQALSPSPAALTVLS